MAEIPCMPLTQVTSGPLFNAKPGTLSTLQNMDLTTDGYAEARGGMEDIKPVGGTGTTFLGAGGYTSALQLSTSYGWIRTFDSAAISPNRYSVNRQLSRGGYKAFPGDAVNDALYFGSDSPFSRLMVSLSLAATWGATTIVYEYWNGAAWTALTTAETVTWTVLLTPQFASWTLPSDWATTTVGDVSPGTGNILKYWMRIRISVGGGATGPNIGLAQGFWTGMKELYVYGSSPLTSATAGSLIRHGQNGTTVEPITVGASLYSGVSSPGRMAGYRGRVILVNGKETKRWDGERLDDLGITAHTDPCVGTNVAGGTMDAGVWRYYIAWGQGPCQNTTAYSDRQDVQALYGPGQAVPVGNGAGGFNMQTFAAERIRIDLQSVTPTNVSSVYIYRTQDLTKVVESDRANFPAFLIQSFRIKSTSPTVFETGFGVIGTYYYDDSRGYAFPQQEAFNYDVSPPPRCKYAAIYQNRLFLMDDDTIFWSDPFFIDRFSGKATTNYMRLARAVGGRHMGMMEFADQLVAWTEDQTWGITNVDLDVPQLFPIHPGIGCIAPDAADVGDGLLIWPARDGFYAWAGGRTAPRKVSGKFDNTSTGTGTDFLHLSYESVGGSMATVHSRLYDVRFIGPKRGIADTALAFRLNLDSGEWSTIVHAGFASQLGPLATIYAPLGNNDAGAIHPLWGKCETSTGAGDYKLYLGELTTMDGANAYTCSGRMFFKAPSGKMFSAKRVKAYYQATDGWGAPTMTDSVSDHIGSAPGTLNTGTPDTGTDFNVVGATFGSASFGTDDHKIFFTVNSIAGGTVKAQRLFGAILEGEMKEIRRGGI